MARYRVSHYPSYKLWIGKNEDGTFAWVSEYENAHLFMNYMQARKALESLPDEKLMYGESYRSKCTFMKFYDSEEHFEQEQEYQQNMRLLRDWGEV